MNNQQGQGGGARAFSPLRYKNKYLLHKVKNIDIMNNILNKYEVSMKRGFTLAEVLITLGIIGIVAAMTLPALISNHNKKVIATQLKQNYSIISQAFTMAQAEYGDRKNWDFSSVAGNNDTTVATKNKYAKILGDKYFVPYLKNVKNYGISSLKDAGFNKGYKLANGNTPTYNMASENDTRYIIEMANGATYFLFWDSNTYNFLTDFVIYIDINGKKKPNVFGKDTFNARVKPDGKLQFYTAECPEGDRECLKNRCITTYTCGALIMNDGWEIADDYPIKL